MRQYNYMRLTEDEMLKHGYLDHLEHKQVMEYEEYYDDDPCWWEADEEYFCLVLSGVHEEWWLAVMEDSYHASYKS